MESASSQAHQAEPLSTASLARRCALALRVLTSRWQLDDEIRAGADPSSAPELALRADQLVSRRSRDELAAGLELLVDEYDHDRRWAMTSAVPARREQVGEARDILVALAEALRRARQVHARGVATVKQLLRDPTSSVYQQRSRGALHFDAQAALDSLLGRVGVRFDAWWLDDPGLQSG